MRIISDNNKLHRQCLLQYQTESRTKERRRLRPPHLLRHLQDLDPKALKVRQQVVGEELRQHHLQREDPVRRLSLLESLHLRENLHHQEDLPRQDLLPHLLC